MAMTAAPPEASSSRESPLSALPSAAVVGRARRARNRRRRMLLGLKWLLLALMSVALWPTSLGGTIAYVAVSGGSMLPSLRPGDLDLTLAQRTYHFGDIILYVVPP